MPGAFPVIYEIVDPSFKHRLVLFLHLLSCYLDEDPERCCRSLRDCIDLGADDRDLPIYNLGWGPDPEEFECRGPSPAKLDLHLLSPDALSFECR